MSDAISRTSNSRVVIVEPRWTVHITISSCSVTVCHPRYIEDANVDPAAGLRAVTHTLHGVPATWVRHVRWASEQPGHNSSGLRCLGVVQRMGTATDNSLYSNSSSVWSGDLCGANSRSGSLTALSIATPAELRRPATRRTHWTIIVNETAKITVYCHSFVCLKLSSITSFKLLLF